MTDHLLRMRGHYPSGRRWGTAIKIDSAHVAGDVLTVWAAAVTDFWTNGSHGINTFYQTTVILDQVDVVTLDGGTHRQVAKTAPTVLSLPGTSADVQGPDRNAVHVSFRGNDIGPGTIGGMFLPCPVEGTVVDGEYDNALITRVGTAARSLLAAITADGSTAFQANREPTINKPVVWTKTVLLTAECSSKVAIKSSRVKGVQPTFG